MASGLEDNVAALQAAGKVEDAAERLRGAGQLLRAAELFASVWRYHDAAALAEAAGALAAAYRYAALGSLEGERLRLKGLLLDFPLQAGTAAPIAEEYRMGRDAAELYEASGQLEEAAAEFEKLSAYHDAARLFEQRGDHRKAGVLYERALAVDPDDARSGVALAKILAHFERYEEAIARLQQAEARFEDKGELLLWLVACLHALGWHVAAEERMRDLRSRGGAADGEGVADVLQRRFGSAEGLRASPQDQTQELLSGRYRLAVLLGAGIAGRVFLAHDCIYERPVAIKVLSIPEGPLGRDAYKRFQREATIAAAIDHRSIVRMFDYNPSGPFLVMEYMEGGALEERLLQRDVSPEFVRTVCLSVLEGLAEVHRRGVVHRDLKPANILLGIGGESKISDFGVSHLLDLGATVTGALFGTLGYMAPEQLEAKAHPVPATDLYAFGVILYRMLTGEMPFQGNDLLTQKLQAVAPLPSSKHVSLSVFDGVSSRLLRTDPHERFESAHEVIQELRAIVWPKSLPWTQDDLAVAHARTSDYPLPADEERERYRVLQGNAGGLRLAYDELLLRTVELRDATQHRGRLEPFAALNCPELQAVYAMPDAIPELVLEWPKGTRMSELLQVQDIRAQVGDALQPLIERFSQAGVVHGEISPSRIVVDGDRVVLLLPTGERRSSADDHAQLEALRAGFDAAE